jgi:hypothetical protein
MPNLLPSFTRFFPLAKRRKVGGFTQISVRNRLKPIGRVLLEEDLIADALAESETDFVHVRLDKN